MQNWQNGNQCHRLFWHTQYPCVLVLRPWVSVTKQCAADAKIAEKCPKLGVRLFWFTYKYGLFDSFAWKLENIFSIMILGQENIHLSQVKWENYGLFQEILILTGLLLFTLGTFTSKSRNLSPFLGLLVSVIRYTNSRSQNQNPTILRVSKQSMALTQISIHAKVSKTISILTIF